MKTEKLMLRPFMVKTLLYIRLEYLHAIDGSAVTLEFTNIAYLESFLSPISRVVPVALYS